jgi:hypothetical protein
MIAQGTSWIASDCTPFGDPALCAAGVDLVAKGGLELGQAGADSDVAKKNNGQKNLLTNATQEDSGGTQLNVSGKPATNPNLAKILSDHGVNPEDFTSRLDAGQLSAQDIAQAVGADLTPEQLAQGQNIANDQAGSILGKPEPNGNEEHPRVTLDENSGARTDASANGNGGNVFGNFASGGTIAGGTTSGSVPGWAGLSAGVGGQGGGLASRSNKNGLAEGVGGTASMQEMMKRLFGGTTTAVAQSGNIAYNAAKWSLRRLGIQIRNPHENIFQRAHRDYRLFNKWRRTIQIAQASTP